MAVTPETMTVRIDNQTIDLSSVAHPIEGDASGKNLLSMHQLAAEDIYTYIEEAYAAETIVQDKSRGGINLLPFLVLKAVMRQPSTRTGGSMTTAMHKLGGSADLISGMKASSEAKGETLTDSWVAFAAQSDILGTRTKEEWGPALAAHAINQAVEFGQLWQQVPVINLGDGVNEHPTQALGDLFTIHKHFRRFEGLKIALVGDHERYRAHHSLMIGAVALGMEIIAIESPAAPIPPLLVERLGHRLIARQKDLDSAMSETDVLYLGRNPDEYVEDEDEDKEKAEREKTRSEELKADYANWIVDYARLQQMSPSSIVMHPRPRRDELNPNVDSDPRMKDVGEMANMIPMRMAIIARHLGKSIIEHI